jgi:hypothetical protein
MSQQTPKRRTQWPHDRPDGDCMVADNRPIAGDCRVRDLGCFDRPGVTQRGPPMRLMEGRYTQPFAQTTLSEFPKLAQPGAQPVSQPNAWVDFTLLSGAAGWYSRSLGGQPLLPVQPARHRTPAYPVAEARPAASRPSNAACPRYGGRWHRPRPRGRVRTFAERS